MADEAKAKKSLKDRLRDGLPTYVALTAAIVAALAGMASLLMARHGGKATSELIQASNNWSYYQAKSLKTYILASEKEIFGAMGKAQPEADVAKMAALEQEKTEIKKEAEANTARSQAHGKLSAALADAVTLFQIAIANAAIAALSKRPLFWMISIGLALVGVACFINYGMLHATAGV
jgi:hypothetical protein